MHYKAKPKLVLGGWYKDVQGNIYKLETCTYSPQCREGRCPGYVIRQKYPIVGYVQGACGYPAFRQKLIYYCSDEEIAYYSL